MRLVDVGERLELVGPDQHVAPGAARDDAKRRAPCARTNNADGLQPHVSPLDHK